MSTCHQPPAAEASSGGDGVVRRGTHRGPGGVLAPRARAHTWTGYLTAAFNSFAGVNRGTVRAGTLTGSPV